MKANQTKQSLLPAFILLLALLLAALPMAAVAAPVAQTDPVTPTDIDESLDESLVFVSGTLRAASSPGRVITLTLNADESATLVTDYLNEDEPLEEVGTWLTDDSTQTLELTLVSNQYGDYDEDTLLVFDVSEDGVLTLDADGSTESYGVEGLTLFFSEDGAQPEAAQEAVSPADPSGVYVSNVLPAADTPGQVVLAILYADGTIEANTYYLNQEPPIAETGVWTLTTPSEVAVTITGTVDAAYDAPQELVFTYNGFSLTYLSLTLNRIFEEVAASTAEPVAYYLTDVLPAASSPGLQIGLVLYADGSLHMVNDYMEDDGPVIEVGNWVDNGDGTITVTLTGQLDADYEVPDVLTFEVDGDQLVTVEWDEDIYGSAGITMTEQSLEDAPLDPALDEASATEAVTETTTLTATETLTETAPVTETESTTTTATTTATTTETSTVDVTAPEALESEEFADFAPPTGAVAMFLSETMPAASTPGRVVMLVLYEDSSAEMLTDYLTGDAPYTELGTWVATDTGIDLTLTGPIGESYIVPVEIGFEDDDGVLTAVEYDESVYGSEGLTLTQTFSAE